MFFLDTYTLCLLPFSVCTSHLVLGGTRVGGSGRELALRVDIYDEEPALPFLQKLHQCHRVLILTNHLAPFIIFLENKMFQHTNVWVLFILADKAICIILLAIAIASHPHMLTSTGGNLMNDCTLWAFKV